MGARNAELNSINSPPIELGPVDGVHQGLLDVDPLPFGPRDPLGAGLEQLVLHGGKSERI